MKVPELQKWKVGAGLEGLLFFAQCLDELLFHHTIATYKAPALNTHSNTFELEFLASEHSKGLVRANTLDSVIEELEWNFQHDPVIKASSIEVLRALLAKFKSLRDKPTQLNAVASALASEVGRIYWPTLRTMIPTAIAEAKNKDEILALAVSFVVESELRGFSRENVYYVAQRFFFDPKVDPKEINSIQQISQFLDLFEVEPSKWTVIFRATDTFKPLKDLAKQYGIEVSETQPTGVHTTVFGGRFLGASSQFPFYLIAREVDAREPHMAKRQAEMAVELLADLASFHNHAAQHGWFDSCLVVTEDKKSSYLLKPRPSGMRCGTQTRRTQNAKQLSAGYEALTGGHMSPGSVAAVARALDYHRAALESKTPENQLLDLWAALEGVLPAERVEGARIDRYVAQMLPYLTLVQAEKIFRDLSQNLYFAGDGAKGIIDSVGTGGDFYTKTTALIVSADLTDKRKELYATLDATPLLRHRCFRCHEMFKSTSRCLETLQHHRNRVRWHIYRIYNSRNQIIHSAQSLPYLDTLVENVHAYVDGLILAIWQVCKRSPTTLAVSSALEIMSASEKSYFDHLAKSDVECTSSNFRSIVFGDENPLLSQDKE